MEIFIHELYIEAAMYNSKISMDIGWGDMRRGHKPLITIEMLRIMRSFVTMTHDLYRTGWSGINV